MAQILLIYRDARVMQRRQAVLSTGGVVHWDVMQAMVVSQSNRPQTDVNNTDTRWSGGRLGRASKVSTLLLEMEHLVGTLGMC